MSVNLKGIKYGLKYYRKYALKHNINNVIGKKHFSGGFQSRMDNFEALLILGIETKGEYNHSEVIRAYSKMISINHPDRGGSPFVAQKIIEAKEILTRQNNQK